MKFGSFYHYSSIVHLKSGIVMPPAALLLIRINVLAILDFCLYMELNIVLSRSVKYYGGILMGIAMSM